MIQKIFRYAHTFITCAAIASCMLAQAAPGDLDPSFDGDGIVTQGAGGAASGAFDVTIQADGKLVTAGFNSPSAIVIPGTTPTEIAVMRFNTNGSLDTTFGGGDGIVLTPIGPDPATNVALANDVIIQPADQKIVVAGQGTVGATQQIALVRYNTDGSLDTTFGGGDGIVTTSVNLGSAANGLAIQTDGKLVIAGATTLSTIPTTVTAVVVARYNTDGSLDTTFGGGDGIVTLTVAASDAANDLALQSDGKIVIVGQSTTLLGVERFLVARFNTDGSLDTTFGAGTGFVTTSINGIADIANDVQLQSDGNIVVAGLTTTATVPTTVTEFAVVRYTTTGALDPAFGGGDGIVTTAIGSTSAANALEIQADGKIIAGGVATIITTLPPSTITQFALARYTTAGALDTTFGAGDGIVTTVIDAASTINGMVLQPCRQIVAAGVSSDISVAPLNATEFALARYQGDNILPVADATAAVTSEGVPVVVNLSGTDANGDSLTFSIVSGPTNGTLSAITQTSPTTAQVTYTPNAGYVGPDSFTFTVTDCAGGTAAVPAAASVTVNAAPSDQPIANPTSASTLQNTPVTISLSGFDPNGDPLTFSIASGPTNGTLSAITQTSPTTADVTYTPTTGFIGSDGFTFIVNDGTQNSDPAPVGITVAAPVPGAPIANPTNATTEQNTPVTVELSGFDADGNPLTFSIVTAPANGTLGAITQTSPTTATVVYTPNLNFAGVDSFTFIVNNGTLDSAPAAVTITVVAVAPIANSATVAVKKNTPEVITLTGFDPNGLPLTFSILTGPTNGTLGTIIQTGPTTAQVIYTPNTGFIGSDFFTFQVNNGLVNSEPALISLVILQNTNPLVDAIVAKYC